MNRRSFFRSLLAGACVGLALSTLRPSMKVEFPRWMWDDPDVHEGLAQRYAYRTRKVFFRLAIDPKYVTTVPAPDGGWYIEDIVAEDRIRLV